MPPVVLFKEQTSSVSRGVISRAGAPRFSFFGYHESYTICGLKVPKLREYLKPITTMDIIFACQIVTFDH